jgi:putative flippase GtrA
MSLPGSELDCAARVHFSSRGEVVDRVRDYAIRLLRFGVSGGVCTLLYAGIVWAGTAQFGIAAIKMNVIGYVSILPVNFLLHRKFTFSRRQKTPWLITRFIIVHVVNISSSTAVYLAAAFSQAPLYVAIVGTVIVVPLTQFVVLDRWVFRYGAGAPRTLPLRER